MHILLFFVFFFFSSRRRHTRYWRDWSSDVCSSDLDVVLDVGLGALDRVEHAGVRVIGPLGADVADLALDLVHDLAPTLFENRSEERRVGKECRSRWSPYH